MHIIKLKWIDLIRIGLSQNGCILLLLVTNGDCCGPIKARPVCARYARFFSLIKCVGCTGLFYLNVLEKVSATNLSQTISEAVLEVSETFVVVLTLKGRVEPKIFA